MTTSSESVGLYDQVRLTNSTEYIRLLQIKGSIADVYSDRIECTLSSHPLQKPPPYRCLSYVWGVENDGSEIEVNVKFRVSVRKNLRCFLERMRAGSKYPDGYLWIDAICINQQDRGEREAQVSVMGAVYAQATQVIAWLGWEHDRIGDASDNGNNEYAETLYVDLEPPAPLVSTGFGSKVSGSTKIDNTARGSPGNSGTDSKTQDDIEDNNNPDDSAATGTSIPPREDPTEAAIDFIRVLYLAFNEWIQQGNNPWSAEFGRHAFGAPEMFDMLGIARIGTKRWAALAHFLNGKWFQRAWIVQEAALAKSLIVVCGLQVLLWDQIVKTCIFLQASGWYQQLMTFLDSDEYAVGPGWRGIVLASMQDICRLDDVNSELGNILPSPLEGLHPNVERIVNLEYEMLLFYLTTTRPFDAGDPRDKVYAPLALLKQVSKSLAGRPEIPFPVHYETVEQVYIEVSALILERARALFLLSHVEARTSTLVEELPSWVPDFSYRGHAGLLDIPGLTYDALPNTMSDCSYDRRTNRIQLYGFPSDQVESFGLDFEEELFRDRDWRPWLEYCLSTATQHTKTNGESYMESFWRTLIGNFDGTSRPAPRTTAACFKSYIQISTIMYLAKEHKFYEQPYTEWDKWSSLDRLRELDIRHEEAIPSVQELRNFAEEWRSIYTEEQAWRAANPGAISRNTRQFELKPMQAPAEIYGRAFGRIYPNRRFFRSRNGYMGLAPISALESDQIWFLSGGRTPYVLRPATGVGKDLYRLVGECYLHGFMDGEVLGMMNEPVYQRIALC